MNAEAKKADSKTIKRLMDALVEAGDVGECKTVNMPTAKSRTGTLTGRDIPVYLHPDTVRLYLTGLLVFEQGDFCL